MKFLKSHLSHWLILLKVAAAAVIIYWLVSQNKLDYGLVVLSLKNPITWAFCFAILCFQVCLGAFRWRIILKTRIPSISFLDILRIQWIGQFFSVILPGAVTGDIIKIGYIKNVKKDVSAKFLLLSIFIDRLVGLNSLLLLAGLASFFFYNDLLELNPILKNVVYINICLFLGSCLGLSFFFFNKKLQEKIKTLVPFKKLRDFLEDLWSFNKYKKELFQTILISTGAHVIAIATFWGINIPHFETAINPKYLFSLIPLGFVAVALPISPAGLGVGHAAFERLFHFIGHTNGASLFNVYWVLMLTVSLCGFFPFIFSKKKN